MNEFFLERMKLYLGSELDAYLESLTKPLYRGLRVNTKKIDMDRIIRELPFLNRPSLFSENSFYVDSSLGNHAYHICGAFYLQEPSASSAVEVLDVQEDDLVLDLCAAPGSKSTQIAQRLGKKGYLVSNEYDAKRAKILVSNHERMGTVNFAVTNSDTRPLCNHFESCFDKVLVDAPCSGEGMMKKHEQAKDEWSLDNVLLCAKRQKDILSNAYKALKKDGVLVYSTCTYAKEENEDVISWFLETYPDMELMDMEVTFGREGFLEKTRRIFPMDQGEGHFIAKLKKTEGAYRNLPVLKNQKVDPVVLKFIKDQIVLEDFYYFVSQEKVMMMNRPFVDFKKIKVLRQGVYAGELVKKRIEPAHAFYMTNSFQYLKKVDLSLEQMDQFMHGNPIEFMTDKGYVAVCFRGICFGFGKSDGRVIKNKIPKGIRLMANSHVFM